MLLTFMFSLTHTSQAQDISFSTKIYPGGYNVSCNGAANGSIEAIAIGGARRYDFLWSTGATTTSIGNLVAGTYSLSITDHAGHTVSKSITLIQPDLIDVFLYPSVYAGNFNISKIGGNDGTIKIDIKGGTPPYKTLWNTGSTKESLDNLTAGTYSVTITDQNSCTVTKSIAMAEPTPLQIVSITAADYHGFGVSCAGTNDGSINLVVSGGIPPYTFVWSNGSFDQNPSGLSPGIHKVIVYDANKGEITGQIGIPFLPKYSVKLVRSNYPNGHPISCRGCANGTITTVLSGGAPPYTYLWSGKASINGQTTANLSNLGPGEYSVEVTDANGCTVSRTTNFNDPPSDDWLLTGNNNVEGGQYIGTNYNAALVFKTNSSTQMVLGANGGLTVNNLAGAGNRLLQTDASGTIAPFAMGTSAQIVLGDGTLGALPAPGLWSAAGTGAFFNAGNVGIGTTTPQYPLEVVGDASVDGNFNATNINSNSITASAINTTNFTISNTLNANKIQAYRITGAPGDTAVRIGDSTITINYVNNTIAVTSTSTTGINKGLGIGTTANGLGIRSFAAGTSVTAGGFQSIVLGALAATNATAQNAVVIGCGVGTDLLINDKDHSLMVGFNSNIPTLFVSKSPGINRIGRVGIGIKLPETSLHINGESDQGITISSTSNTSKTRLLSVSSNNNRIETQLQYNGRFSFVQTDAPATSQFKMIINEDGKVAIGSNYFHADYMLSVNGKIICEEVNVKLRGSWPDYVFNENYQLMSIDKLKEFTLIEKHLPNMPTASEVEKAGVNVSEMITKLLKNQEEQAQYIILLNEQNKKLQKEIELLKK